MLTGDVADIGIGLMLAVRAARSRRPMPMCATAAGRKGNMPLVTRVCGKKLGIVGMGRVGVAVAKRRGRLRL